MESTHGAASPATVSKPAGMPAAIPATSVVPPTAAAAGPSPSLGSLGAASNAGGAASPLSFTLRVPAESAAEFEGREEEQQGELLAAFERALPGGGHV